MKNLSFQNPCPILILPVEIYLLPILANLKFCLKFSLLILFRLLKLGLLSSPFLELNLLLMNLYLCMLLSSRRSCRMGHIGIVGIRSECRSLRIGMKRRMVFVRRMERGLILV